VSWIQIKTEDSKT